MAQKLAGAQTAQCSPDHLTTWLGGGGGWSRGFRGKKDTEFYPHLIRGHESVNVAGCC